MKIIITPIPGGRQKAKVTIDTKGCFYPYAIRESLELALQLEGYSQEFINELFNQSSTEGSTNVSSEDDKN